MGSWNTVEYYDIQLINKKDQTIDTHNMDAEWKKKLILKGYRIYDFVSGEWVSGCQGLGKGRGDGPDYKEVTQGSLDMV